MSTYGLACLLYRSRKKRVSWEQCFAEVQNTSRGFHTQFFKGQPHMSRKHIANNNHKRGKTDAKRAVEDLLSVNGNTKEQLLCSGKYTRAEFEALIVGLVPPMTDKGYVQGWRAEIVNQIVSLGNQERGYRFREYLPEPTPEQEPTLVEA
jgi:hypothetical protein